jgi:hypothetical protein
MTRAAAFLSAALLAASLGVAQDTSTSGTASRQNNNGSTTITTPNPNQSSAANSGRTDAGRVQPSHDANVTPAETSELSDDMKESLAQNPQPNSTALQLLGLIGVGSLIAGFFMRR